MEDSKPYQDVVLLHDMSEEGLYADDVGTITSVWCPPGERRPHDTRRGNNLK